ncbi:hypothetical protein [Gordonia hankookensis]|uniref:Uncharacterized protein n=1 Tax=Gordonia hankookensis TaxID=589403 RepID=A0ABR7W8F2_9ACTN|nr:hypothetical protein [Gordonia hankookensis]MBD1318523.1 hypothetical protein [Gordonia hankookensis]
MTPAVHAANSLHESAHAVTAVLLGARVTEVRLIDDDRAPRGGWCEYAIPAGVRVPEREIIFAGPWADARFTMRRRPDHAAIRAALAGSCDSDDLDAEAPPGGAGLPLGIIPTLEALWRPAIVPLAKLLCETGTLGHRDIADALGVNVLDGPITASLAGPDKVWNLTLRVPVLRSPVDAVASRR